MPQLDITVFFNQLFWLILSFNFLYFFVLKSLVPALAKILKTQEKKVSKTLLFNKEWETETQNLRRYYDSFFLSVFKQVLQLFITFQARYVEFFFNSSVINVISAHVLKSHVFMDTFRHVIKK